MLATTFLIGLASGLHCAGMCGPLVMAAVSRGRKAIVRNLIYNIGRILTYGLMGSLVSFAGMGLSFAGIQNTVSIVVGILILFVGMGNIHLITPSFIGEKITGFITFIRSRFKLNIMFLGMTNGLLPCGMTLVALSYCVTLNWPTDGFLAMIAFGAGTLPVMLGLSSVINPWFQRLPVTYKTIRTILLIVSGMLLIGRGVIVTAAHNAGGHNIVVCGVTPKK